MITPFLFAGKNEKVLAQRQRPDQDLTEEELARYVQELQKHQVSMRLGRSTCTKSLLARSVPSASVTWRFLVEGGAQ